ncbi:fosfomycin resistance glutathione transferase [uncultured Psychrobacter sp.]|uniref:fosfomycin resistance glutathione transferase n=1 Tax=uncultured Psychrobacter sp. TaxID=259303 RepID=UPI003458F1D1
MITGLNHITLTVQDLDASLEFYTDILDFKAEVRWDNGAYLHLDGLWLCLSLGEAIPAKDYTHLAFSIEQADFATFLDKIRTNRVFEWKENTSEGDSLYFVDPDGHKLEVHAGDLQSRLESLKSQPYSSFQWLN